MTACVSVCVKHLFIIADPQSCMQSSCSTSSKLPNFTDCSASDVAACDSHGNCSSKQSHSQTALPWVLINAPVMS